MIVTGKSDTQEEKSAQRTAGSALGRHLAAQLLNMMIVAPGLPQPGGIMMTEGLRGTMIDEVMMTVEALTLIMTVVGTMTDVGTTEGVRTTVTTTEPPQDMQTVIVDGGAERVKQAAGIFCLLTWILWKDLLPYSQFWHAFPGPQKLWGSSFRSENVVVEIVYGYASSLRLGFSCRP